MMGIRFCFFDDCVNFFERGFYFELCVGFVEFSKNLWTIEQLWKGSTTYAYLRATTYMY